MKRPEWHRLTDIDLESKTGLCQVCGVVPIKKRYRKGKNGSDAYRCHKNYTKQKRISNRPYRIHLKESCEMCGFIPQHEVQLDVDHIDGNSNNSDPSNLQTLCANCHRLKTYINKDYESKKMPPSP